MRRNKICVGVVATIFVGAAMMSACGKDDVTAVVDSANSAISSVASSVAQSAEDAASAAASAFDSLEAQAAQAESATENVSGSGLLSSAADLDFKDVDGNGKNYSFTYNGEEYSAIYTPDHWKIINSYKIDNSADMQIICQMLIDTNPIHGSDMVSYRTADDMVYEWLQHNFAYELLPVDNTWKAKAKDVDFNPEDQGLSFVEIYERQTGKEFSWEELFGG